MDAIGPRLSVIYGWDDPMEAKKRIIMRVKDNLNQTSSDYSLDKFGHHPTIPVAMYENLSLSISLSLSLSLSFFSFPSFRLFLRTPIQQHGAHAESPSCGHDAQG
mgnify:CR=1 FL=1